MAALDPDSKPLAFAPAQILPAVRRFRGPLLAALAVGAAAWTAARNVSPQVTSGLKSARRTGQRNGPPKPQAATPPTFSSPQPGADQVPSPAEWARIRQRLEQQLGGLTIELQEARQTAEQAGQAKNQFLAGMSHELRTPLNAIIGFAQMLQHEYFGPLAPKQHEYVDDIQQSARHLLSVISAILDLSKMSSGQATRAAQPIDLKEFCRSVVAVSKPLAAQNKNSLALTLGDLPRTIRSDATKLRQCLLNLIGNACKFTESGSVTLDVQPLRQNGTDWISFSVTDTGIGIAEENRGNLFRVFSQADTMISERFGGTGLGLALTAQLATFIGGNVDYESCLGVGSTFRLLVPTDLPEGFSPWTDGTEPLPIFPPTVVRDQPGN